MVVTLELTLEYKLLKTKRAIRRCIATYHFITDTYVYIIYNTFVEGDHTATVAYSTIGLTYVF